MSLRAPVENENADSVMPADSLSDPERFKVQGSIFNVPSSNAEPGTAKDAGSQGCFRKHPC
jgi:hypothetical protein